MAMTRLYEFIKSIAAGIMISIGGMVFLSCDNRYVGALLFSTGLISVVLFGVNLYTGRIGYVLKNDRIFFIDTLLSILGNAVGCLVGLLRSPIGNVSEICANKLAKPLPQVFIDAVFCGILIYVCVEIYKKHGKLIGIVFCIPTFILCGFEHSIADMFYLFNARVFTPYALLFVVIVILGNALGGLLFPLFGKLKPSVSSKT